MRDYLLVEQTAPKIDHFARQSDDNWLLTSVRGRDGEVRLVAFDAVLRLADVYRRITFAAGDGANTAQSV